MQNENKKGNTMKLKEEIEDFLLKKNFKLSSSGIRRYEYTLNVPGEEMNVVINLKYKMRAVPINLKCEKCDFQFIQNQYVRKLKCPKCQKECVIRHASPDEQLKIIDKAQKMD